MSCQDHPLENSFADLSTQDARKAIAPGRTKRNIDWPQDFVPSIQGEYDKLELPEFVSGFLIMIKTYDSSLKDAMLAHLEYSLKQLVIRGLAFMVFISLSPNRSISVVRNGRILSLSKIKPQPFFAIQIYKIHDSKLTTLVNPLTTHPRVIVNRRFHPQLKKLAKPGITLALVIAIRKMKLITKNITAVECARRITRCFIAQNVAHQSHPNDN